MLLDTLETLSPLDGRYAEQLESLRPYFSEQRLMYERILVEIRWFEALADEKKIHELPALTIEEKKILESILQNFSLKDAQRIKKIEKQTQHDVKAVEYFIKEKLGKSKFPADKIEFIHFALTSEDVNNLAYGRLLKAAKQNILQAESASILKLLQKKAIQYAEISMLSRTHGQPATPTTLGKEFANFAARLTDQLSQLKQFNLSGKCNGAVGNYNAHLAAYPTIDWLKISKRFVQKLGLEWTAYSTQIEPHDTIAELSHVMMRINTILLDLCRDLWGYISMSYFHQKSDAQAVGSSTMPHKINPIHFENGEGNLGLANALFEHFSRKLPHSRFQRDLSDSTVVRNIGIAFAYSLLAYRNIEKGLNKISPNKAFLEDELKSHWELLAEPIQTVMRRYGCKQPYEQLKALTKGKEVTPEILHHFIEQSDLPEIEKKRLKLLTPENYLGLSRQLAKSIKEIQDE